MIPTIVTYDIKSEIDDLGSSHQAFYDAAIASGWYKKVQVENSLPYYLPNTTFGLYIESNEDGHQKFERVRKLAESIRAGPILVKNYIMTPLYEGFPVYENFVEKLKEIGKFLGFKN